MSVKIWRYSLWTLTLATVWWALGILSAVVAGKGADPAVKALELDIDTQAGEI